jgi:methyltransferase-like protein/2-polyprenyl-3-methyl-5-hydroxy-6-metoxy-1,4-benzoquinol methylase
MEVCVRKPFQQALEVEPSMTPQESQEATVNELPPKDAVQGDAADTGQLTSYDEVPYGSYPYAYSHPNRLSVVGTLFGMTPPALENCRVLELGSASGGNLIPMADMLPEATFLGIDLSSRQIAEGNKQIKALGLANIELRTMSIMDVAASLGQFDYIICHGVYSWVPEEVRRKILEICATNLSPQGVAYVSYNTYPGWHLRGTVREIMLFHVRKWKAPQDRVNEARGLLNFLVNTVSKETNAYSLLLRAEMERLAVTPDNYLLHEHLESVNEPIYFHEFAEAAAAADLQFMAEAQSGARWMETLGPEVDRTIRKLARDVVEYEQYLDILRNRTFRQSLLCHKNVTLDRDLKTKHVRRMYVASGVVADGPVNVRSDEVVNFRLDDGLLSSSAPVVKAGLSILSKRWPEAIPFAQLLDQVVAQLTGGAPIDRARFEELADTLAINLIQSFTRQVVHLYTVPPRAKATIDDRPVTSPIARLQVATDSRVTTLLHESIHLNDIGRKLVGLADGSRSQSDILDALQQSIQAGELVMPGADPTQPGGAERAALQKTLDECFLHLSRLGLLSA